MSHKGQQSLRQSIDAQGDTNMDNAPMRQSITSASPAPLPATYQSQQLTNQPQQSASPAPMFQRTDSYNRQQPSSLTPQTPQTYGQANTTSYNPYNVPQMQAHRPQNMAAAPAALGASGYNTGNLRGVETYVLSDTANAAIPSDIRQQFQTDEQGRVLFWTTPPIDRLPRVQPETGTPLMHSAAYLAKKLEKETRTLQAGAGAGATAKAMESKEEPKTSEMTFRDYEGLSTKQRDFLDRAHKADTRARKAQEAREQAAAKGEPLWGDSQFTEAEVMKLIQQDDERWWRTFYEGIKSTFGEDFMSYEDFRENERLRLEKAKSLWRKVEEEKARLQAECKGIPVEDLEEAAAIENVRKRLCESGCGLDEKVKLRRVIAGYERRHYKKPVYLDDIDPRYPPM